MSGCGLIPNARTVCASLLPILAIWCSPPQCWSESEVLDYSIDIGAAVEDADIAPDGKYIAAAVRECEISAGMPTCRLEIEVWSSADRTRVAKRTLLSNVREVDVAIRFSADGDKVIISDGQGKLLQWLVLDLSEIGAIDLELANGDIQDLQREDRQERARLFEKYPRMAASAARVAQIEASPSLPFLAAVIRVGGAEMVRVLDLTSGKVLDSWGFLDAVSYKGAAALSWSQDGKHLAISLPATRGSKHAKRTDPSDLLIYDVISGQLSAKFEVREKWEASLAAPGRVIFAGNHLIVSTHRTPDTFFKPSLRVLDSKTGETIKKIDADWTGVRDPIAISGDGKVLLGFIGHARKEMIWSDLTSRDVPIDTRIGLWEMPAGRLIFASEELGLIPYRASFRLNATGNWVIGFDQGTKLLLLQLK